MKSYILNVVFLSALGGLAIGCDGGGTAPGRGPARVVVDTLPVLDSLTGFVRSDGSVSDSTNPTAGDFEAIDTALTARGFVGFDLSKVPPGTTIKTANLRLYQRTVDGAPYTGHGVLVLDHLDPGPLDPGDYDVPASDSAFAIVASDPSTGIKLVNVLPTVRADLAAGHTVSRFRLRFSLHDGNKDGITDDVTFKSSADFPPPLVIITY